MGERRPVVETVTAGGLFERAPGGVIELLDRLRARGFCAWVVGGAVRDWLLGRDPCDWDVVTDAPPQEVQALFKHVIPVGLVHGILIVISGGVPIEVTGCPGRGTEGLLPDLARRDFTLNAMAIAYPQGRLIDPHGGRKDLAAQRLRAVGRAAERFAEDPVRTLRAVRLVSVYGFHLHRATALALKQGVPRLSTTAIERIRDELAKLVVGRYVVEAFRLARGFGLLSYLVPELLEGVRRKQNEHHIHDIYHHAIDVVDRSPQRLPVRLAALLHDIAKPRVRKKVAGKYRFYGHEIVGAEMTREILERLRFPSRLVKRVETLVRHHLLIDVNRWKDGAVRRLVLRVGPELIDDLLDLAVADQMSHRDPEEAVRSLENLRRRIREQLEAGTLVQTRDLAVNGRDVMRVLGIAPGRRVGEVLQALHREVLEHPENNNRELLLEWMAARFDGAGKSDEPDPGV